MNAFAMLCRLPDGTHNLIVATHTSNVLIYRGNHVVWVAKAPTVPVAICVAPVGPLQAALVLLDDEGLLSVCYLGTAPPATVLGLAQRPAPDMHALHARQKELGRILKDKTNLAALSVEQSTKAASQSGPSARLQLRSQVLSMPAVAVLQL